MSFKNMLGNEIIIIDGAMGTALQAAGLKGGEFSESFNFNHPDIIENIHKEYIDAGCHVITTNTFSSNHIKLKDQEFTDKDAIEAAIKLAKQASSQTDRDIYIAHGLGPSGELMKPVGNLDFDTAYELFKRQIITAKNAGAHLHLFETFSDISELRAGVIAAKENSHLPVCCSVTFDEDGRMLLGTDPETAVYMLQDLGIDAIGVNCSLGPEELVPLVKRMLKVSKIPVLVQPNAGMPRESDGEVYYDVKPEDFVTHVTEMVHEGVAIVGGCCGTTPQFINQLSKRLKKEDNKKFLGLSKKWYEQKSKNLRPVACTPNSTLIFEKETVIMGERINPTGKKKLKEALKSQDYSYLENEAVIQEKAGANIININVGMEDIDELSAMESAVDRISRAVAVPLQIDSSNPEVIENAVRKYGGKPIINSVNGEQQSMDRVFPIVAKYGTSVIALTLDENGIPGNTEERLSILDKIIKEAAGYGITKDRIIVDTLALTVSTDPLAPKHTLKAIESVACEYHMDTVLGASNISFGLPRRDLINRTFLSMAVYAGLSSVITDPTKIEYMDEIKAAEVLSGKDEFAEKYICYNNEEVGAVKENTPQSPTEKQLNLEQIILDGRTALAAEATNILLQKKAPMDIIEDIVVPSLEKTGDDFESGITFLPEMIKSADAVKVVFDVLKPIIAAEGQSITKGQVVVATVEGDIHDIGKNIVKTILENYGYEVIDLGKDVPTETIIKTIKTENIKFVGLSALMTTTMINMKPTIEIIKKEGLDCRVAVGGAVLTQEYADKIGADFYCETAMDTVRSAEVVFAQGE